MTQPGIASLVERVRGVRPTAGGVRLVLIDGPAGAGKTTLAAFLAARLDDAPVAHADDMYEGWDGLVGLETLLVPRVLEPLARGQSARFERWDWHAGRRGDAITVPPAAVVIVEGVGVAQRSARALASLVLWVEAPTPTRHRRWLAREGDDTEARWASWARSEAAHHSEHQTRAAADVIVDASS